VVLLTDLRKGGRGGGGTGEIVWGLKASLSLKRSRRPKNEKNSRLGDEHLQSGRNMRVRSWRGCRLPRALGSAKKKSGREKQRGTTGVTGTKGRKIAGLHQGTN